MKTARSCKGSKLSCRSTEHIVARTLMQNSSSILAERAKEQLRDCSRVLMFDESLSILYSTFEVSCAYQKFIY